MGDHYWKMEINMDCDETEDGWFELKGYGTGGLGWESDISQGVCDGTEGGTSPLTSNNHMAKCGFRNFFTWGESGCTIDTI